MVSINFPVFTPETNQETVAVRLSASDVVRFNVHIPTSGMYAAAILSFLFNDVNNYTFKLLYIFF